MSFQVNATLTVGWITGGAPRMGIAVPIQPPTEGGLPSSGSDQARKGRLVDALAARGDEGRGTLRKAWGRREHPLIPGCPNGETHLTPTGWCWWTSASSGWRNRYSLA